MGTDLPEHKKNMNALAKQVIEDGQDLRPFNNYISECYDDLKGKELNIESITFNDRITFYKHIKSVIEWMIQHEEDFKKDKLEEYLANN